MMCAPPFSSLRENPVDLTQRLENAPRGRSCAPGKKIVSLASMCKAAPPVGVKVQRPDDVLDDLIFVKFCSSKLKVDAKLMWRGHAAHLGDPVRGPRAPADRSYP